MNKIQARASSPLCYAESLYTNSFYKGATHDRPGTADSFFFGRDDVKNTRRIGCNALRFDCTSRRAGGKSASTSSSDGSVTSGHGIRPHGGIVFNFDRCANSAARRVDIAACAAKLVACSRAVIAGSLTTKAPAICLSSNSISFACALVISNPTFSSQSRYIFRSCLRPCLLGFGQFRPVNQVRVGHQVTPRDFAVRGPLNGHALSEGHGLLACNPVRYSGWLHPQCSGQGQTPTSLLASPVF